MKYQIYFILPLYIFCRNDIQPWYYNFNRYVNLWNELPPIDISSSLASIKVLLQNYFMNYFNDHTFNCLCPSPTCHPFNTNRSFNSSYLKCFICHLLYLCFILAPSHDVRPSVCHSLLVLSTTTSQSPLLITVKYIK